MLNTLEVKLTSRKETSEYNVQINQATLEILSLIFEFKIAASWHVARFLTQQDQSTYLYLKLRRMWQAQLLESFKIFTGSAAGMPVYYMLGKKGLKILGEKDKYSRNQIKNYPKAKTLLAWSLFKHEAQVVEMASLEAKNSSKNIVITFEGEDTSQKHELLSDKNVEALTPDYTVHYKFGEMERIVHSEFERTAKSKEAILKKIERYQKYLPMEQRSTATIRVIFQTEGMEQSFWLNLFLNKPSLLQNLRIYTTHLSLLKDYQDFLKPTYASAKTVKLSKPGRLKVDMSQRIKLF